MGERQRPYRLRVPLAPGLIAAGISAALSDHKWRAAAYATLLTYGGLFALFLMWRLVATPLELDRERQRFIDWLSSSLADTRSRGCPSSGCQRAPGRTALENQSTIGIVQQPTDQFVTGKSVFFSANSNDACLFSQPMRIVQLPPV